MSLQEIGDFLQRIAIHYPRMATTLIDENGNVRQRVEEEWYRLIGCLSLGEALERLDKYMMSDNGKKQPSAADFVKLHPVVREYFHVTDPDRVYHLEFKASDVEHMKGQAFDQNGYRFTHDPLYEGFYHYNKLGQIVTDDGLIAF